MKKGGFNEKDGCSVSFVFILFFLFVFSTAVDGTVQYTYDDAGRLVKVKYENGKKIEYTYENPSSYSVSLTVSGTSRSDKEVKSDYITVTAPAPGTLTITATEPDAAEKGQNKGKSQPLTVKYGIEGSATNGVDYETLGGTIVIPVGTSSATIFVNPLDETEKEGKETVQITIEEDNAYSTGSRNSDHLGQRLVLPLRSRHKEQGEAHRFVLRYRSTKR